MVEVIVDTDIGDDIDDAFALALALRSPELEVKAVTTVYGDVYKRGMLVSRLLSAMEREDIPVALGCPTPLLGKAPTKEPIYFKALENNYVGRNIANVDAVSLMEELIEDGVTTIVTLGPMTNMALLLLKRADLAPKLRIIVMGGAWSMKLAEYNVHCDPEAAHVVLESQSEKLIVGLDVTLRCVMSDEMLEKLKHGSSQYHRVLTRYLDEWMKATGRRPILHDPLAIAASFNPDLLDWEQMNLKVELKGEYTRGYLIRLSGKKPNCKMAVNVREREFLNLFGERVVDSQN